MKIQRIALVAGFWLSLTVIADAQWSTFHGDNQRRGVAPVVGPVTPQIKWSFDLKGPMISSPVIGPDGTIYTGSVWSETVKPKAFITAIRPDGKVRWRFPVEFVDDQTMATPAVAPNGTLYVGTYTGQFYAIDANGKKLWMHQAAEPVFSHALVGPDGTVYVTLDGQLTAFTPAGVILWQYDLGENRPGGPTLDPNGTIYATSSTGTIALNPNGTLKWSTSIPGSLAPPVVSPNGDVIVCSLYIWVLDPANGSLKWNAQYGAGNYGAPAVDAQGNIYHVSDWDMWKYSPTGTLIWSTTFQQGGSLGKTYSSVVLDSAGNIYLGMGTQKRGAYTFEKRVVVYNNSGVKRSHVQLPEATGISSPAIGPDGTLYIGCMDGKLYAIQD
ncbi:MAG: PQQ-binding-like beta-propeller repeat protein [Planctomycetota bacterium]